VFARIDSFFRISENGTTIRTEILAGITTFLTMAYIVFVNPAILRLTGLTAVVVAFLFLLCLFLSPLAETIPTYATAPALLFVACLMMRGLADINWRDITDVAPSVVTTIAMPLTYSIANGIGFGFVTYAIVKLASGRGRETNWTVYILAGLFAIKYAFLG